MCSCESQGQLESGHWLWSNSEHTKLSSDNMVGFLRQVTLTFLGGLHEYLQCLDVMFSDLKSCQFSCVLQCVKKCPKPLPLLYLVILIRWNTVYRPFCKHLDSPSVLISGHASSLVVNGDKIAKRHVDRGPMGSGSKDLLSGPLSPTFISFSLQTSPESDFLCPSLSSSWASGCHPHVQEHGFGAALSGLRVSPGRIWVVKLTLPQTGLGEF